MSIHVLCLEKENEAQVKLLANSHTDQNSGFKLRSSEFQPLGMVHCQRFSNCVPRNL